MHALSHTDVRTNFSWCTQSKNIVLFVEYIMKQDLPIFPCLSLGKKQNRDFSCHKNQVFGSKPFSKDIHNNAPNDT